MITTGQCYTKFRESGASDVWKLFEEVLYKSNNEFTGLIRCTKCQYMSRYHGHVTGTSHMRRHKCFGALFPDSVKSQKKDTPNKTPRKSYSLKPTPPPMPQPEKRSINLENGDDGGNAAKRSNSDGVDNDDSNASATKIELRTYNNQTVITPKVKNALASTIITFCYSELVNLECVCSNSFRNVLRGAAVKVSTPLILNHQYLKMRTKELFDAEKASIIKDLKENIEKNIGGAIVSDFKDDLCIMSYSFIDQDWNLRDKVLRGSTRINSILDFISHTLGDYELLKDTLINKFTYISNAGQLSGVNVHLSSVSHLLDDLVETAIFVEGKHDQLVENCKYICSELKILPDRPICNWMFKFDVVCLVLENLDKFSPGNFSMDTILPTMNMLKTLLTPFKEASLLMRNDVQDIPTINQVALQYFKLQKCLLPIEEDAEDLAEHKKKLAIGFEQNFELHLMHKIAVFLWPNFRHLKMFPDSEQNEVYAEVRRMIDVNCQVVEEQETMGESIKAQTQYSEWESVTEFDQDEVSRYLQDKFNHCNEKGLLTWWKEAASRYPKLSHVARSVLCVPASVTSIERRHRLHSRPPVDEELLFLHCNLATT